MTNQANISYIGILLLAFTLMACGGESNSSTTTNPPITDQSSTDSVVVMEPPTNTIKTTITPKDSVLKKLTAYYNALANKSDAVGEYFSPTVSRYFSRENISRIEAAKQVKGTYKSFSQRQVKVDPGSMKLTEEEDGWWVEFKGTVQYTKTGQNESSTDNFHNLFRFDQDYLIDQYGAYSKERDPAAAFETRSLDEPASKTAANPDLESAVAAIVSGLATGDFAKVDAYVTAEHGLYLAMRPGAFDAVYHGEGFDALLGYVPFFEKGIQGLRCNIEKSNIPNFSCDDINMFSKKGCFLAPVSDYKRISDLMVNLNSYEVTDYKVGEIAKARRMQKLASQQVVQTSESLQIVLGQDDSGAWKLLVLDFAKFNCGA